MNDTTKTENVERVRKIYAKDIKENERLLTVFKVGKKQKQTRRNGQAFVILNLVDRTGLLDARIFDDVEKLEPTFAVDDYVLVKGHVQTYQGHPQLVIEAIERLDAGPIDAREFNYVAPKHEEESPKTKTVSAIREQVERIHDPFIKKLLLAFLDDATIAKSLPHAPAAKGIHHAYRGGLAEHILSVMKLSHRVADQYPMADRDLLLAGAFLHDLGKVFELSYAPNQAIDYTDEGRLVGHLVMTAQLIREKASRIEGFPPLLEQHLTHIVISHHGKLEYGSPKLPVTLEALLVHLMDLMDSQVASWLDLMSRDSHEKWTEPTRLLDRHLWKGVLPTQRHKAPVEPRARKHEKRKPKVEKVEKTAPVAAPPQAQTQAPKTTPRDANLPEELIFKPFTLLAPDENSST